MIILDNYILHVTGEVNQVFGCIPILRKDIDGPDGNKALELVLKELRRDREKDSFGPGVPEENPSKDPATVISHYTPYMQRQKLYSKGFPMPMGTYKIVDAFVCLGSRFGLEPIPTFVEVCRSQTEGNQIWANLIYVADSEVPAAILKVDVYHQILNDFELTGALEVREVLTK